MWKLIIADEEPKIQRGVSSLVQKMPLNIEVAGLADNGLSALDMAKRIKPDLMLVDICMPFLNGLELIKHLHELRDDMKIIILTGYEEFEYAIQALELSVYAYLLKPLAEHELMRKLEGATAELSAQRKQRMHYAFALEQLERRRDMHLENFLRDAALGEYSEPELIARCEWLGLAWDRRYELLLISPLINGVKIRPEQEVMLRYKIEGTLRHHQSELKAAYLFADTHGNIVVLNEVPLISQPGLDSKVRSAVKEDTGINTSVEHVCLQGLHVLPEAYGRIMEAVCERQGICDIVASAQSYISKHYMNADLGLGDVAAISNVTPTYLSRLMKQELGVPFSKYLNTTRINHAIALIEKGLRLKDIAARVGYSSPYYFSTAFKKIVSIPPNEYRSEALKSERQEKS